MSLEKAKIGDAIYDVIDIDEYYKNPTAYSNSYTAIKGGDGYVYPIRSKTETPNLTPCSFVATELRISS